MPAITSQNLILGLALVLTVIGLVGLAPSMLSLLRRRRLLTQLANLSVEQDDAHAMFPPTLGHASAVPTQEPDVAYAPPATESVAGVSPQPSLEGAAYVSTPSPAERAAPALGAFTPAASPDPIASITANAPAIAMPGPDGVRDYASPFVPEAAHYVEPEDAIAEPEDMPEPVEIEVEPAALGAVEPDEDDDDLMAMFKDTVVHTSAPAVLTENLEVVSAADLVAQARELRDLLRRAA